MNNTQPKKTIITNTKLGTFWYSKDENIDLNSITIPLLYHEIILNFGDIFSINNSKTDQNIHFSNIRSSTLNTRVKGEYHAAGILLNPNKIYQTFGLSMKEFTTEIKCNPEYILFNKKKNLIPF